MQRLEMPVSHRFSPTSKFHAEAGKESGRRLPVLKLALQSALLTIPSATAQHEGPKSAASARALQRRNIKPYM